MKQQYIGTHAVRRLKSGSFNVVIKLAGTNSQKSITAPTMRELRVKVEEYEATGRTASRIRFAQAVDDYIDTCELQGYSPSTIAGYRQIRRNGIGILGDRFIDDVTVTDIQRQINAYSKTHSPKSTSNVYGLIHKVMRQNRPTFSLEAIILPKQHNHVNDDAGIVIPDDSMIISLLEYTANKYP